MSACIYLEGGPGKGTANSKDDVVRCRKAFSMLIEKMGFAGRKRKPSPVLCGSRNAAFKAFKTAHAQCGKGDYVAMLVDSEDPVSDTDQPWKHLKSRDKWEKPETATDEQVFLMTTSMETWIAADRDALKKHYGSRLVESKLPPLDRLEGRERDTVFKALENATSKCSAPYGKGARSFAVLEKLDPAVLRQHLPAFARMERILNERLG